MYDNNSPRYALVHWRNPETQQEEETLESFLFWLETEADVSEKTQGRIRGLVNQFLGRDMKKIKAGEQELLNQWVKACEGK